MAAKFALRQHVRKIGRTEIFSVEQITELEAGEQPLYSLQKGADFATREWVKESEIEPVKPTPEQQREYTILSGKLQAMGHLYHRETWLRNTGWSSLRGRIDGLAGGRIPGLQDRPDYVNYAELILWDARSFVQHVPLPIQRKHLLRLPAKAGSLPKPPRS